MDDLIKKCIFCEMISECSQQGFIYIFNCKRCGDYILPGGDIPRFKDNLRPIISGYIRENQNKYKKIQLTQATVDVISKIPYPTVNEKIYNMMIWLQKQTEYPGKLIEIDISDNPNKPELIAICYANNNSEIRYFVDYLNKTNLISKDSSSLKYYITVTGFNWLESQSKIINSDLSFCAMSFSEDHRYIYDSFIQPATNESGYKAIRVDEDPHNHGVVDKIFALIRQSKFVISDLSGNKDGVYYEAGFAKGLSREVIFTCERSYFDKIHFDVQHLNLLIWDKDKLNEAKEKLRWRIEGTIGRGSYIQNTIA